MAVFVFKIVKPNMRKVKKVYADFTMKAYIRNMMFKICILCILMCSLGDTAVNADSEYIIKDSDVRYLTDEDVELLSLREINYAKNEIFARHGRRFHSAELQRHFNSKSWYEGTYDPDEFDAVYSAGFLNDFEMKNADFLAQKEHEIDPNGYPLDIAAITYESILDEYRYAIADGFSDFSRYPHILYYFDKYYCFYQGEKIYYAEYDFFEDGLPELVIGTFYEETEYHESGYTIADVYGTDGSSITKLDAGNENQFVMYRFCENNILESRWVSGGRSAGGSVYYQLFPNAACGEKIEEIGHSGGGERYKVNAEGENVWIQSFEYEEIMDSYPEMKNIPFEWKEII